TYGRGLLVMPGFMPGIHIFGIARRQVVDGRDKPGHDRVGLHPVSWSALIAGEQVAVARERPEREELPVAVVAQIEHARETRRGEALLAPEPVFVLRVEQILDAARDRGVIHLPRRHQA